ncbi:MAG: DcrB-related protein [Anaerolineae bacterium]|nr:DcrB-related protein [Anaerolineae bacterium]MCA9891210.1 DcrB-related protein [Anaerolineae bacterium]MCA9893602.1 DcrB-related protein [Anaerolineae bacterium]
MVQFMQFQGPNFTMDVPTEWLVTSSPQFQVMFTAPKTHEGQIIRTNFIVTLRPTEENVTAEAVAQSAREMQQREYPGYQLIDEMNFAEQGGTGFIRRYSWVHAEQKQSVTQTQAFFILASVLFTLTGTRLTSESKEIDDIFDHMVQSFRLRVNVH